MLTIEKSRQLNVPTPLNIQIAQNFSLPVGIEPVPEGIGNFWNGFVDNKFVEWQNEFIAAVKKVKEREKNYCEKSDALNELLHLPRPETFKADLERQKQIKNAINDAYASKEALYESICKAQQIKHDRPERNIFMYGHGSPEFTHKIKSSVIKTNDDYLKPIKKKVIPEYNSYLAELREKNTTWTNWVQALSHVESPASEFHSIKKALFAPKTSPAERAKLLQELIGARDRTKKAIEEVLTPPKENPNKPKLPARIHKIPQAFERQWQHPQFPLSDEQKKNFEELTSQESRDFETIFRNAEFYAQPTEQNLQQINDLKQRGQIYDYHCYSSLYAEKLHNDSQSKECVDFATVWMKNADETTPSPEQVLHMGWIYARANDSGKTPEETEDFYQYYKIWVDSHPEVHLSEETTSREPTTQWTKAEQFELLTGNLTLLRKGETTREAMQCYRKCDQLDPSPLWKVKQGEFYVSVLQWEKAKQLIPQLPDDHAKKLKEHIAWSQYRVACSVLEVGSTTLLWASQYIPEGNGQTILQSINFFVQVSGNQLIQKRWIHKFNSFPIELRSNPDFVTDPSPLNTARNLFYSFRNIYTAAYPLLERRLPIRAQKYMNKYVKPAVSGATDGVMILSLGSTLYHSGKKIINSPKRTSELTSIFLHMSLSAISLASLGNRCLWEKQQLSPTWRAVDESANQITRYLAPVNLICRVGDVASSLAKRSEISPEASTANKRLSQAVTIIQSGIVLGELALNFPARKTAQFLLDAHEKFASGEIEEGVAILTSTKNSWFTKQDTIQAYLACKGFFELLPHLREDQESQTKLSRAIIPVNQAIEKFKENAAYEPISDQLTISKIGAYLGCNQPEKAVEALPKQTIPLSLQVNVIFNVISRTINLAHQTHFDRAIRILELFYKPGTLETYKPILEKYKKYLEERKKTPQITPQTPPEKIKLLINRLDDLIIEMEYRTYFNNVAATFHLEKVCIYLDAKSFEEAQKILNSWNVSSEIYKLLAHRLISTAIALDEKHGHQFLKEMDEKLNSPKLLITRTVDYFALKAKYPHLNPPPEEVEPILKAITGALEDVKKHDSSYESYFQIDQAIALVHAGKTVEASAVVDKKKSTRDAVISFLFQWVVHQIEHEKYRDAQETHKRILALNANLIKNPLPTADLHDHTAIYLLDRLNQCLVNDDYLKAMTIIKGAKQLTFNHYIILEKYESYILSLRELDCDAPEYRFKAIEFINLTDSLLFEINKFTILKDRTLYILCSKLQVCVNIENFEEIKKF